MNYVFERKKGFLERLKGFSATIWIIIISCLFFIVQEILFITIGDQSIKYYALQPISILHGQYLWTLISHIFSHGEFLHLFVNMFVLFSLGGLCERIIGRKRFLWFYLISGIFAGLLSVFLAGYFGTGKLVYVFGIADAYMVGASGAIFAICGLFVVLLPKLRFSIIFLPFFSLPAYIMVPLILFLTWLVSSVAGLPIGNVAHFGGFIAGLGYGFYLRHKYKRKVLLLQRYFR